MELKTVTGHKNVWSQNTVCANSVSKTSLVGKVSYTRNENMELKLPNGLSSVERAEMQMDNINRKLTDHSMSAYSEKMRRISLERHQPRLSSNTRKPNNQLSTDVKTSISLCRPYDVTRSESDLTRQSNVGRYFGGRKNDSDLLERGRNHDKSENRLLHFRNRQLGVVMKERVEDEYPSKSGSGTGSARITLNKTEEVTGNDCDGTVSESIVEITPFPAYKESTFYKQRMRSSRLRFAQSEYTDRTEQIANKIRPKFTSTGRFGHANFAKVPLWKQRALEARTKRWKRTLPPKPPPKTYHHIFRYSDAVKELYSSHDSSCDGEHGQNRDTNSIVTFCDVKEEHSVSDSAETPKSVLWNSEGNIKRPRYNLNDSLVTKERHHLKDSLDVKGRHYAAESLDTRDGHNPRDNPDAKSVQFKLPTVGHTASSCGPDSSFQKHSNQPKVNTVSVND